MVLTPLVIAFCLVSAFTTFGLGVFVLTKNSASSANRLFFAAMISATYWALGEFFIWYPGTYDSFSFWLRASSLWPFTIVFMYHCVLTFTHHPLSLRKNRWKLALFLYLPCTLIALAGFFTDAMYIVATDPVSGLIYVPSPGSPVFFASTIYAVFLMGCAIAICFLAWRHAPRGKVRRQVRLVTAAVSTVVLFGALSAVFFPLNGIFIPNLVFIGIVFFSVIIAYAIFRYGLFTLNPETAVPDLIKMMPDGLILSDPEGRILTANASAARIFGVPGQELAGTPVNRYLPDTIYTTLRSSLLSSGTVTDLEASCNPGFQTTVSISAALVKDPDGEPAGFIIIVRDISGRKATENALAVANEKISLLTKLTRHDISNLVTGLDGYLMLLKERKAGNDDDAYIRSCIDIVEKIEKQLQFAREYQDIGVHLPVWQSVPGLVDRARGDLSSNGIGITAFLSSVEIFADPLTVKVFYNILENSVRHGEHLTQIRVSTSVLQNRDLLIVFEDDGIGIPDADKERIFRYGTGKNTGLGLALSRDILAVTGIRLIETGTSGCGARFEILVPASGWRYT